MIAGLASGLSRLDSTAEEYHFLSYPSSNDWLKPYIHGPCRILACKEPIEIQIKKQYLRFTPVIRRDLQRKA